MLRLDRRLEITDDGIINLHGIYRCLKLSRNGGKFTSDRLEGTFLLPCHAFKALITLLADGKLQVTGSYKRIQELINALKDVASPNDIFEILREQEEKAFHEDGIFKEALCAMKGCHCLHLKLSKFCQFDNRESECFDKLFARRVRRGVREALIRHGLKASESVFSSADECLTVNGRVWLHYKTQNRSSAKMLRQDFAKELILHVIIIENDHDWHGNIEYGEEEEFEKMIGGMKHSEQQWKFTLFIRLGYALTYSRDGPTNEQVEYIVKQYIKYAKYDVEWERMKHHVLIYLDYTHHDKHISYTIKKLKETNMSIKIYKASSINTDLCTKMIYHNEE